MCACYSTHTQPQTATLIKLTKTEVRCTVLFVWREVVALIQARERLCWRGQPVYRCKARCAAGRSTVTRRRRHPVARPRNLPPGPGPGPGPYQDCTIEKLVFYEGC
ncbi:unnamed protein product [Danaus chrysippus]|uniref:(African queen) hypothetical protein n=1 Tax=Danaus chrysippus TaxID=151541 RepID=A0A8J2W9E4_9NEOP|nr:unnamed protein product [Danaus chrysippus]